MTRECMRDDCSNERQDKRGTLGRFCSKDCYYDWKERPRDNSGVASVLAKEIEMVSNDE